MKAFVLIATKGRPKETYALLNTLSVQTHAIEKIVIVGSEASDVAHLDAHPLAIANKALIHISKAGSCVQRNVGLNQLLPFVETLPAKTWFVAIFDDDFRPAKHWLESAARIFEQHADVVGLGGWVIADGVTSPTISEQTAQAYLSGDKPPLSTPWQGHVNAPAGLYGCNMAFRGNVAVAERFDENLPLYGWQEDLDFGVRATKLGALIYTSDCVGVHLGVTGGRTSGVRFGYSQMANPIYLVKKGTMTMEYAKKIMLKNVLSNCFHTVIFDRKKDYKGRLYGNFLAFYHFLSAKIHPTNILDI